ncbi:Hypothetical predicted protein [Podarcis lilfordi]|uniref:Uncharacterized protein n=1 Tax=Podarcis lilfordi TaxID=74358 RepID=A0AA35KXB7_9SAUR|nr:Hypothetical predicted protein [Podarcis lilfordi]
MEGSIPEQEEEKAAAAAAAPPPLLSASSPSLGDKDGCERLVCGEDKTLLGTEDAMPQAFLERLRLMSAILQACEPARQTNWAAV